MTDVSQLLSARRADLSEGAAPIAPSEVIPPADGQTGELLPEAVPPSAPAGAPVATAPAEIPTQFPLIPPKVLGGLPYASNYMKLARTIHDTELVPKAFKGRPDAIMAAMMYGYELGLGPMQALNGLHVIEGKVGQDAELMRALITEQGHLFVLQSGKDEAGEPWATVYCRRNDWPDEIPTGEFTWTMQDGREAGLVEWYEKWTKTERGGNRKLTWNPHGTEERPGFVDGTGVEHKFASSWANYGEDMCIARATARAARANFSDVLKGMSYTPEELAEFDGGRETPPTEEASPSPQPTAPAATPPASPETASTAPPSPAPDSASPPSSEPPPATDSAPAAPASPPTKAAGPTKKAAPRKAAAAEKAAPIHTANPRDLPSAATGGPAAAPSTDSPASPAPAAPSTATPQPSSDDSGVASQPDLEGHTPPAADPPPEPGATAVTRSQIQILRELIDAQPEANRRLLQSFLVGHFPGKAATELSDEQLQLAINIAGGWPQSADQYPIPEAVGETAWEGFSAFVVKFPDGSLEGRCQLCQWKLPESPTNVPLPDFRRLELAKQAAQSHEADAYEDGTPYCPGRVQPELGQDVDLSEGQ